MFWTKVVLTLPCSLMFICSCVCLCVFVCMRVRVVVQSLRGEEAVESVYRNSQKDLKDNLDNIPLIPQEVRDLFQVCRL